MAVKMRYNSTPHSPRPTAENMHLWAKAQDDRIRERARRAARWVRANPGKDVSQAPGHIRTLIRIAQARP